MRLSINKKSIGFIDSDNMSVKQAEFLIIITSETPFFEMYFTVLEIIYVMIQLRRKKYYPQFKSINEFLKELDYKNIIYVLDNKIRQITKKLSSNLLEFNRPPVRFKYKHIKGIFNFPGKHNAKHNNLIRCFYSICQNIKYSNFILILTAILLEYFVIFVCTSRKMLSDLIFFFSLSLIHI